MSPSFPTLPPAVLYKYLSPARVDVLENQMIRFTQPSVLNDPFDSRPMYVLPRGVRASAAADEDNRWQKGWSDYFRKFHPNASYDDVMEFLAGKAEHDEITGQRDHQRFAALEPLLQEMQKIMLSGFDEFLGICSLSETPSSLLMWAHYAQNHEGFALGFRARPPLMKRPARRRNPIGFLSRVRYCRSRPVVDINNHADIRDILLAKGDEWSYEREWRILWHLKGATKVIKLSPLAIHLFEFQPTQLAEIYLGARVLKKTEARILRTLRDRPNLRHVKLYRMQLNASDYGVFPSPTRVPGRKNDPFGKYVSIDGPGRYT